MDLDVDELVLVVDVSPSASTGEGVVRLRPRAGGP